MIHVLLFSILFVVFYLGYYFIFDDMLRKEKYTKISELVFLTHKFQLDKKKMSYKKCLNGVAIMNAFIIAITVVVVRALKLPYYLLFIIAFLILISLIFIGYMSYGKILQKKWGMKNGNEL